MLFNIGSELLQLRSTVPIFQMRELKLKESGFFLASQRLLVVETGFKSKSSEQKSMDPSTNPSLA